MRWLITMSDGSKFHTDFDAAYPREELPELLAVIASTEDDIPAHHYLNWDHIVSVLDTDCG